MQPQDIDFIIVGAAKSATTWLQKSLQADPDVFMPDPELHYFSRRYDLGDRWYLEQFAGARPGQLVGEKSNSYLDDPRAAPRLHALLPRARLVAQLRNPVERAYSDYCMLYRRGEAGADIDAHLDPRRAADGRFLKGGLYHDQLDAYLDCAPTDRLIVLFYEDLLSNPEGQIRQLRGFLGLQESASSTALPKKVKDRTAPMASARLRHLMKPLKPLVRPLRGTRLFDAARGWVVGEVSYPRLTPALRDRLVDFYRPDVDRLGALVGRDLSGWLTGQGRDTSFGPEAAGRFAHLDAGHPTSIRS